jgi:3-phenylpropionate/trans-cinnamate dioxygenase ferredoxin subunit
LNNLVKIAVKDDIPEGACKRIELGEKRIALFNVRGEFFAIDDTCSHEEASLSQGELEGHLVECPLHGSRFDVRTGQVRSLPAVVPVDTYELVIEGEDILISLNSE